MYKILSLLFLLLSSAMCEKLHFSNSVIMNKKLNKSAIIVCYLNFKNNDTRYLNDYRVEIALLKMTRSHAPGASLVSDSMEFYLDDLVQLKYIGPTDSSKNALSIDTATKSINVSIRQNEFVYQFVLKYACFVNEIIDCNINICDSLKKTIVQYVMNKSNSDIRLTINNDPFRMIRIQEVLSVPSSGLKGDSKNKNYVDEKNRLE